MTGKPPLAFFSYARADSDFALGLAKDLKAFGVPVWIDQLDIRPGQQWDNAVQEALTSCPQILVVLSPTSANSRNVMDEVSFALDEQKTVIPVLYRECDIPFRLRRVEYADFRRDYATGMKRVLQALGAVGLAESLRTAPKYLNVIQWFARVPTLALAAFSVVLLVSMFTRGAPLGATGTYSITFALGLAQLAAWRWELQGSLAALSIGIAGAIFIRDGAFLLIFTVPAVLFLIHLFLSRKYRLVK